MTVTAKRRRPWDNAMQCIVSDLEHLTGRQAFLILSKERWQRAWAIGAPLGMTKLQAENAAWLQCKAVRLRYREQK